MSGGLPSDEVAEDYRTALGFLVTNDKYIINNLTVIAKENTEHADAISKVLEERIRTNIYVVEEAHSLPHAPPNHKLPALYVLDSIAKNIGTPYTLFLGHNLYKTFMVAYSLVDHQVRKKLDEMLKTWKNPVPGSIDTRPVFPVELTRSIDTALIKARTAAVESQQQHQRGQLDMLRQKVAATTSAAAWCNTTTPLQTTPSPYSYAQYAAPQSNASNYQQPAQQQTNYTNQSQQTGDIVSLLQDIEILIITTKDQFARTPLDVPVQTRLKALLDLQTVLKTQQVPPHMLHAAREQINQIQNAPLPSLPPTPQVQRAVPIQQLPFQPPSTTTPIPTATSLADLLASVAKSRQTPLSAPTNSAVHAAQYYTNDSQVPSIPPTVAPLAENPLITSLRAAGMLLSTGNTQMNGPSVAAQAHLSYMPPPPPQANTPPTQLSNFVRPPLVETRSDVQLTSASLKIPRPYLVSKIYEARPNQCFTCGRRFLVTEDGRSKKARHLDWHFRTNQRLADSAKKGQSRSWYVDELEWIRSRENQDGEDGSSIAGKDPKALAAVKNDPKTKFIPAPSDSALASLPCPVCQEKFNPSWNDEVQDFVWMDAEKIGSRIYHASCYSELQKDGANTPRISTPDSVLGKRKAEVINNNSSPAKIKKETAA
ncbi:hypothetical protein MMC13_006025 [Lambiella insularis]|nr:hypothetical protein [Lambiella insularis]